MLSDITVIHHKTTQKIQSGNFCIEKYFLVLVLKGCIIAFSKKKKKKKKDIYFERPIFLPSVDRYVEVKLR